MMLAKLVVLTEIRAGMLDIENITGKMNKLARAVQEKRYGRNCMVCKQKLRDKTRTLY